MHDKHNCDTHLIYNILIVLCYEQRQEYLCSDCFGSAWVQGQQRSRQGTGIYHHQRAPHALERQVPDDDSQAMTAFKPWQIKHYKDERIQIYHRW